jgi:uncharacterized protein
MATITISGGTGMIGTALSRLLIDNGHDVIILSRSPKQEADRLSYAAWNIEKGTIDEKAISNADYIVHLAGADVGEKRWTEKRKKEIVESRTKTGELIVSSLEKIPNNVKAVISASAIGWYGRDPLVPNPKPFTENAPAAKGFLGETCKKWEESIAGAERLGKRLVYIRTAIVFSSEDGALKRFQLPIKFGVAGILGSGKQAISWIHINDISRIYMKAIEDDRLSGPYNAAAPQIVSNKELTMELAKKMKGKAFVPIHVPEFALRIGLGELSIEVLKSCTVSSQKITDAGYSFSFPTLQAALNDLV